MATTVFGTPQATVPGAAPAHGTVLGTPRVPQVVTPTAPAAAPAAPATPAHSAQFGSLAQGATGFSGQMGNPEMDPGYEWRRNQGQKGLERAAAARGTLMTGGSLADIMDYNQGLASQEYANAWDRAYKKWTGEANISQGNSSLENQNRATTIGAYQGLINTGLNAANSYVGAANNAAAAGANAQAGSQVASGRAWGDVARDAGNTAGQAWMWNYPQSNTPLPAEYEYLQNHGLPVSNSPAVYQGGFNPATTYAPPPTYQNFTGNPTPGAGQNG